jgi:hypothetical protein
MIIFDNTDWYPNSTRLIREKGFHQVDFNGFGPINNYCWTTSIFFNKYNIGQYHIKAPEPIGGIKQFSEDDQ